MELSFHIYYYGRVDEYLLFSTYFALSFGFLISTLTLAFELLTFVSDAISNSIRSGRIRSDCSLIHRLQPVWKEYILQTIPSYIPGNRYVSMISTSSGIYCRALFRFSKVKQRTPLMLSRPDGAL